MPSTTVSLNDESLNGSWIDINSASQIPSPMDNNNQPDFLRPVCSTTESVQNLGLISFQVERFLQEAQRNQINLSQQNLPQQQQQQQHQQHPQQLPPNPNGDNNSGIYMSDSDLSLDDLDSKALIESLRRHHEQQKQQQQQQQLPNNSESNNINDPHSEFYHSLGLAQGMPKVGDCLIDQLSDSLSLLSRASAQPGEQSCFNYNQGRAAGCEDFDWLWDWTDQPQYFAGQEWKVHTPKQEYLMRQRQLYCANKTNADTLFSGEVISLFVLTNILSILIGAGLTYGILTRRSSV